MDRNIVAGRSCGSEQLQGLPKVLFHYRCGSGDDAVLMAAMAATQNLSAGCIFQRRAALRTRKAMRCGQMIVSGGWIGYRVHAGGLLQRGMTDCGRQLPDG